MVKNKRRRETSVKSGGMLKEGNWALAGNGQDGRRVFRLVEEDGRLIGRLQLHLGRAW